MGSTESTLPSMEETRGAGENQNLLNQNRENVSARRQQQQQQRELRRETDTSLSIDIPGDDPWWWEIENENLVLDRIPNVTANSDLELENDSSARAIALSDDFNTLLKIGENVNLTLNSINSSNMENPSEIVNATSTAVDAVVAEKPNDESVAVSSENLSLNKIATPECNRDEREPSTKQSLEEFKEELRLKRMTRQTAVQDLRDEMTTLRKQLAEEQQLTRRLRQSDKTSVVDETIDSPKSEENPENVEASGATAIIDEDDENVISRSRHANIELANAQLALQLANSENLSLRTEVGVVQKQVSTLKEVVACCKHCTAIADEDDENVTSRSRHANIELANAQLALQLANSENLSLRTEVGVVQKQVGTLKEVVACCKQMLAMKEEQCTQLKTKLSQIEESFGEREMKIMSDNLRQEYERQLGNIRQLRQLYEERQRIAAAEHENLQRLISIKKDELAAEQERTKGFEERNQTLLKEVETANNELAAIRDECNEHKFEKKTLKEEMGAVNTLFSQMVMGFNGKNNLDIDRLGTMLEENRTLLNDMATKEINCSDGATLPKLLFELVEQAAVGANNKGSRSQTPMSTEEDGEEIVNDDGTNNVVCTLNNLKTPQDTMEHTVAYNSDGQSVVDSTQTTQDFVVVDEIAGTDNTIVTQNAEDNENANININTAGNNSKKQHQRKIAVASTSSDNSKTKNLTSSSAAAAASTFKLHEPEVIGKVTSTQEIIGNLPKVWKVLMELLSHHKIEKVQFEENGASEDCYKSVETPNGPKAELSVSKTYIKLKDLILEKKSLVKETNRLKTLNCHLDYRLNEQEKRLSAVSLELTKTWHLVGKMQRQHRQLHTQEQILRYQLQQKRRLLTELKDELEYCRRKWAAARAKNDESQEQCNELRREFAKRKLEDANNSAESGYSDTGPPSDEDEHGITGIRNDATAAGVSSGCCKRDLRKMFEHSRKIKRMQSTSPGRAVDGEIELRWNSAPPTCGWRAEYEDDGTEEGGGIEDPASVASGTIPKHGPRTSRSTQRINSNELTDDAGAAVGMEDAEEERKATNGDRVVRIQRLEEQCKSLIQQVIETSDNRERLEIQLCRFQDEVTPVQHAIPLEEFISKKRLERMTRASSAPATPGTLTPREEEYTRKRSERLGRLEEESRQLISRIKRTSDRGHYLRCSVDRLHRGKAAVSREGSFESNTEEDTIGEGTNAAEDEQRNSDALKESSEDEVATCSGNNSNKIPLTATEEAYTTRRAERLKRLEAEGKQLLSKLTQNTQRVSTIDSKLESLHEKYGSSTECAGEADVQVDNNSNSTPTSPVSPTIEKRIENIERISFNRDERLRILEEEGNQLISRLSSTSARGTRMINRIAEREQSRLARQTETPTKDVEEKTSEEKEETTKTTSIDSEAEKLQVSVNPPTVVVADTLLPTLKNVACSTIVSEELAECVTVTTTSSQIAGAQQGAIPKSKPLAQLSAARVKSKQLPKQIPSETESLEEMVKRLKDLPFPDEQSNSLEQQEDREHDLD